MDRLLQDTNKNQEIQLKKWKIINLFIRQKLKKFI